MLNDTTVYVLSLGFQRCQFELHCLDLLWVWFCLVGGLWIRSTWNKWPFSDFMLFVRLKGLQYLNIFSVLLFQFYLEGKGSYISSLWDHSKCFTFHPPLPSRRIHSNTNSTSLGSIQPCHNYCTNNTHTYVSTAAYSQILVSTAE